MIDAAPEHAVFASYLIRFRPLDLRMAKYLALYLQTPDYWRAIGAEAVGIALANVNARKLSAIPVPLPPQNEQDRVVEALENHLTAIDAGERELGRARDRIGGYRASLQAEVFGNWPDHWERTTIDQLAERVTSGSRDWKPYYGRGKGVFVLTQNVRMRELDLSRPFHVDPPKEDLACRRSQIEPGDLLINIVGAVGTVARVRDVLPEHYVCQSVALLRLTDPSLSAFLEVYLASEVGGQRYFGDKTYGLGRPHLSFQDIKAMPVPLPPPHEREEIAKHLFRHEQAAALLTQQLTNVQKRADHLKTGLLRDAFTGRLLPQDPSDAPASELLARIQAERAERESERRVGRASRRSKNQKTPSLVRMEEYP